MRLLPQPSKNWDCEHVRSRLSLANSQLHLCCRPSPPRILALKGTEQLWLEYLISAHGSLPYCTKRALRIITPHLPACVRPLLHTHFSLNRIPIGVLFPDRSYSLLFSFLFRQLPNNCQLNSFHQTCISVYIGNLDGDNSFFFGNSWE